MYSKITQFRQRGVRRSDRDINNDPGTFGAVMLVGSGLHTRMEVREWGNTGTEGVLLPALWDARCITWHAGMMLWQGFQHASRGDQLGSPVYFQEWRIEVVGMAPDPANIRSPFYARNSEPT